MYQSRLHATNGIISIALDALNGEVLEFTRESTWDNVTKNHVRKAFSLLEGLLHTAAGDLRFHVPRYLQINEDSMLTPTIDIEQGEKSARITLRYPSLMAGEERLDIGARITIDLPPDECRTLWQLTLENRTDDEIGEVAFPQLNGMWLGETWADDVLVLPRFAGWQVENPTKKLAAQPVVINWKWQEYIYGYQLNEMTGVKDERDAYTVDLPYSGAASMLWMDLYDPNEGTGIYLTCRNNGLVMKGLRAMAFGEQYPGIGLSIVHNPCLREGVWQSEVCVAAIHEGDWHWAADDYRAWFQSLDRAPVKPHRPEWFEKSAGLVAHYDFQYQLGGVVHHFKDIPQLMRQAQSLGMNHLLLSGWNEDGFDNGFPHYTPNHRLGTEQELKDALRQVREMGGHVAFYVNARLCNTGFADQQERIRHSAIMNRKGDLVKEKYGAANITFALLCNNDTTWRNDLANTVRYLTHDIGADSMYLDQLAMAQAIKCYHPEHKEHACNPTAWNQGYEKLLRRLCDDHGPQDMALIFEGCNDGYGPFSSGQLITTLGGPFIGRLPEVYKYTFPEQILVDMMNPRRNSAMRPEHVARHSTEFLHKAFVTGAYLWCYDLEWDNTWRRDPEQYERLRRIVALRVKWLEAYGQGRFTDTVGLVSAPRDQLVKRFEIEGGQLLACASESGLSGKVAVRYEGEQQPNALVMSLAQPEARPMPVAVEWIGGVRCAVVELPADEMAVIAIR